MQFTLLAAAVISLALVQVQARPLTRSVTYMTYATDLYVDPWVVMQGQRAASTASETALVATQAVPSPATDATGTATTLPSSVTSTATTVSSSAEGTATALSSSAAAAATALPSSLEADPLSSTQSESTSEPPASSTEEEQYYSIQTQNAE